MFLWRNKKNISIFWSCGEDLEQHAWLCRLVQVFRFCDTTLVVIICVYHFIFSQPFECWIKNISRLHLNILILIFHRKHGVTFHVSWFTWTVGPWFQGKIYNHVITHLSSVICKGRNLYWKEKCKIVYFPYLSQCQLQQASFWFVLIWAVFWRK